MKNLFITGKPGCGKTTLIKETCLKYIGAVSGFYTEEIREDNARQGFRLCTFDGTKAVFAKKGLASTVKLNKYGIDLAVLEQAGISALRHAAPEKKVVVIDEIGSMEIASEKFRSALAECLAGTKPVLATIRYHSQPFTDQVKKMNDTELVYLSRDNFIEVKRKVAGWLAGAMAV